MSCPTNEVPKGTREVPRATPEVPQGTYSILWGIYEVPQGALDFSEAAIWSGRATEKSVGALGRSFWVSKGHFGYC